MGIPGRIAILFTVLLSVIMLASCDEGKIGSTSSVNSTTGNVSSRTDIISGATSAVSDMKDDVLSAADDIMSSAEEYFDDMMSNGYVGSDSSR